MSCLKCGQEVSAGQVFCDSCLADMEQYPVKPGTPVIIPNQTAPLPSTRNYKRTNKSQDLITAQRRLIGWLLTTILILILAVAALTVAMFHFKNMAEDQTSLETTSTVEIVSRETIFDNI